MKRAGSRILKRKWRPSSGERKYRTIFNDMNRSIRPITLALIFALTVSSCASQYGSGWLSDAEQATHDGYGAWVRVTTVLSETLHDLDEGELLAFSKDSLYLLIPGKRSINAFARHDIDEVVGNTYERGGYAVFAVEALVGSIAI